MDNSQKHVEKPNKRIALASDFDGTIFFQDIGTRNSDVEAIQRFRAAGHLFGINTGRAPKEFYEFLDEGIKLDFGIYTSGTHIQDAQRNTIFDERISRELAQELIDFCKPWSVATIIHANDQLYQLHPFLSYAEVIDGLDDIEGDCIRGVSVHCETSKSGLELQDAVREKFAGRAAPYMNISGDDIVGAQSSKGKAISKLPELFDVDVTAAIGDSLNDIPQIEAADVGFTFDYAFAKVQQSADYVVKTIAEAIDILLKKNW